MTDDPSRTPGWAAAVLVAPVAAAVLSGATAWSLVNRPDTAVATTPAGPTSPATPVTEASDASATGAPVDPRIAALRAAVAARATEVAALRRAVAELRRRAAAGSVGSGSTGPGTSVGSGSVGSGSTGPGMSAGSGARVALPAAPAPPAHTTTGASG